jgi:nicotinamide-nucleotide amidase
MSPLALELIDKLRNRGETIAVAESVTGGELSAALTSRAGASHVFKGGVIAYSNTSKVRELGVSARLLEERSAYSAEVAAAMALGVMQKFETNWAISTTGVAGPGSSHGVEPGRVWICIIGPDTRESLSLELSGGRDKVRAGAVTGALAAITRILSHL